MENIDSDPENQPENNRPSLPKRSPLNKDYVTKGVDALQEFVNDLANRDPEIRALHDQYNLPAIADDRRSTRANYLRQIYQLPAIEPEKRNTPGHAGKVNLGEEVDPLDPKVPASELGVELGKTAVGPIFDKLSREQGFDLGNRHTQ